MLVSKIKTDMYKLDSDDKIYEVKARNIFELVIQAVIIWFEELRG